MKVCPNCGWEIPDKSKKCPGCGNLAPGEKEGFFASIFGSLKKKDHLKDHLSEDNRSVISENEQKFYQPDSYYTDKAFEGTVFERSVISFDDRKKISFPSKNGLYVAEILLLEYCSYGTYPHPKNGYPGFWWFEYGIRDVGTFLKSLEARGFIRYATAAESLPKLTVAQLKDLLTENGLPVNGKKAELITRIQECISEEALSSYIKERKYVLTELGVSELDENQYIPYMHKHPKKTTGDIRFGPTFNVWSINETLKGGDTSNWKNIVREKEFECDTWQQENHNKLMVTLDTVDASLSHRLRTQDAQIEQIKAAEANYTATGDIDTLILFWENVWKNGGLLFNGSHWTFRLPDLYIQQKQYDDALRIVRKINKPIYQDKANRYIEKINKAKQYPQKK